MNANDLSKLRGQLSLVFQGNKEAKRLVEEELGTMLSPEARGRVAEYLDSLREQEIYVDETLEAILGELEARDVSG